ncbi:vegetatible incompatibility HET-E-1 [Pyrenophora seminiperda CCB06]|uniref:Vegetatible incompatibility HET-E-1 n=1 Tax=Pyrenophora seminiperda CCB06 TaxID=1302712 RepID=A0A3M7LZY8_9PLEO|nr:vegetatible incompatibility HET-E-1 [Pyrenophora seminiperda CCB06]
MTYSGNQAYSESTNFYGNIHGNVNVPEKPREAGEPLSHQCLRDLRVTDPREDRARIEGDKDTLLQDCYAWILDDVSFQRWRTQNESRLLWIKGDPGKGKTMITMGVIVELELQSKSQPCLLAYFFCQSTMSELNNTVAVPREIKSMQRLSH